MWLIGLRLPQLRKLQTAGQGIMWLIGLGSGCSPVFGVEPVQTGGERGIRTLDRVSPIHAFQACAFNHSAISPVRNKEDDVQSARGPHVHWLLIEYHADTARQHPPFAPSQPKPAENRSAFAFVFLDESDNETSAPGPIQGRPH